MGLIGDKFNTLSRWWRKNELKNFSLIFLSALSAHLFAVTTFKMYLYYFTKDGMAAIRRTSGAPIHPAVFWTSLKNILAVCRRKARALKNACIKSADRFL